MKRAILTGVLALTGLACAARSPAVGPETLESGEGRQAGSVPPRMLNTVQVDRALTQEYPRALKEAGIGGTTVVSLFIDKEGIVRNQEVAESSGHAMLDSAALRVARFARFSPAKKGHETVALWISIEITFTPR